MESINITDRKLMEEIINNGYRHAANSFSSLTGQKVIIESSSVELCTEHSYIAEYYDHKEDLTILQTDVIGQLRGASYLIFNEDEKKIVSKMSMISFGNNVDLDESVILMEIDNIISAAVITELSNALKLSIYGDVPKLMQLKNIQEFQTHINQGNDDYYILANTSFIFENHSMITPIFIWKMEKKIIEMINV